MLNPLTYALNFNLLRTLLSLSWESDKELSHFFCISCYGHLLKITKFMFLVNSANFKPWLLLPFTCLWRHDPLRPEALSPNVVIVIDLSS